MERFLISGLAGAAILLQGCAQPRAAAETAQTPSVSSFTLTTYRGGEMLWRMDAASAVFSGTGNFAEVFDGQVRFYGRGDYVSHARFERASVDLRTRDARFPGRTVIHTVGRERITTRDMVYVASDDTVRSSWPVTVIRAGELIRGSGFVARNGFQDVVITDNEILPH